ncbi:MAG: cytochrome P450 [Cyanobacteria bacterium P01_H01_bin.121]
MKTIPSVSTVPLLQCLQWIFDPLGYLETNARRYGDLFIGDVLPGPSGPLVFVSHPEALQQILSQDNTERLTAPGEANQLLEPLLGANSLILLSGKLHRRRRRLIMPPFHGDRLTHYASLITEITAATLREIPPERPFSVRPLMQKITMRVILQVVFGLYQGDRYEQLESLLAERLDLLSSPLASATIFWPVLQRDFGSWSLGHRIQQLKADTDALIYAEVRDRRAHPDGDRTDVLSLLLAATDEAGQGLTDDELHDELMTLLFAGHETTATTLTWAVYWLSSQPEIGEKLTAEVRSLPETAERLTVNRLPYLSAFCNETLRIYPVAMLTFPRRAEQPLEIMGYQIEPGMLLMGCIYATHHRDDLYPQSQDFRPDRFLERQFSSYEFIPFGAGSRRCVGAALAQLELKLILRTLLAAYSPTLLNQKTIKPTRRGVTLGPTDVRVKLVEARSGAI